MTPTPHEPRVLIAWQITAADAPLRAWLASITAPNDVEAAPALAGTYELLGA